MHIEVLPDDRSVAITAADIIIDATRDNAALIALPTGATPVATYDELRSRVDRGDADLRRVSVYAIDEFVGVQRDTPGTNSAFYRQHLDLPWRALHIPNPAANDPAEHIRAFADAIRRAGGLDLCVLGVGTNGHIAFNEPPSERDTRARVVDLESSTRKAQAQEFGSLESVPLKGMTLGVADLLDARSLLVLATGAHKAHVVRRTIKTTPSADVPASWLQTHDRVTWLLDAAAASELRR